METDKMVGKNSETVSGQDKGAFLNAHGVLNLGDYLSSPNGMFKIALQADGNLVLTSVANPQHAKWASDTYSPFIGTNLAMQSDGNLVLCDQNGKSIWASDTNTSGKVPFAVMQDDGNFVVYEGKAAWATNTNE